MGFCAAAGSRARAQSSYREVTPMRVAFLQELGTTDATCHEIAMAVLKVRPTDRHFVKVIEFSRVIVQTVDDAAWAKHTTEISLAASRC